MSGTQASTSEASEAQWFDEAREIDDDWIEVVLKTADGEVSYRVPRRTHFDAVDAVADLTDA
jgi:hypothetical protein